MRMCVCVLMRIYVCVYVSMYLCVSYHVCICSVSMYEYVRFGVNVFNVSDPEIVSLLLHPLPLVGFPQVLVVCS